MNAMTRELPRSIHADEAEKLNYLLGCIDSCICPKCGESIHWRDIVDSQKYGEPRFYLCIHCGWNDIV